MMVTAQFPSNNAYVQYQSDVVTMKTKPTLARSVEYSRSLPAVRSQEKFLAGHFDLVSITSVTQAKRVFDSAALHYEES